MYVVSEWVQLGRLPPCRERGNREDMAVACNAPTGADARIFAAHESVSVRALMNVQHTKISIYV